MTALKILTYIGKLAGFLASLHVVPFIEPFYGVVLFFVASLVKDTVNRIGDFLDDGRENQSWKAS